MPRFYLTTAIDYANGDPHLGHAIGRDNNCLTNLKGSGQLYDCFFTMLRIEVAE